MQPQFRDRRRDTTCPPVVLSEEQLELLVERAADRAVQKITEDAYRAVGKGVVEKAFWIIGVIAVGLFLWLQARGFVKL